MAEKSLSLSPEVSDGRGPSIPGGGEGEKGFPSHDLFQEKAMPALFDDRRAEIRTTGGQGSGSLFY